MPLLLDSNKLEVYLSIPLVNYLSKASLEKRATPLLLLILSRISFYKDYLTTKILNNILEE